MASISGLAFNQYNSILIVLKLATQSVATVLNEFLSWNHGRLGSLMYLFSLNTALQWTNIAIIKKISNEKQKFL